MLYSLLKDPLQFLWLSRNIYLKKKKKKTWLVLNTKQLTHTEITGCYWGKRSHSSSTVYLLDN